MSTLIYLSMSLPHIVLDVLNLALDVDYAKARIT